MEADSCGVQAVTETEVSHLEVQTWDLSNLAHMYLVVSSGVPC